MPQLVNKAIAAFPEPTIIFDCDDGLVAFTNPAVKFLMGTDHGSVSAWEGEKLADLINACQIPYEHSVAHMVMEGEMIAAQYRDDIRAWIMGTQLGEAISGVPLAMVTAHARGDEAVAWLQHTRIRQLVEMALYIADARSETAMAVRLIESQHSRLEHLESTLLSLTEELGTLLLAR